MSKSYVQVNLITCHPERSAAESKDPVVLRSRIATGFLDFARNDSLFNVFSGAPVFVSARPSRLGLSVRELVPDPDNAGFPPSDMGGRARLHNVSMTFRRRLTPQRYHHRAPLWRLPG